ncbi:MAG: HD domain-containing protein [Patescibacteria group bacterium]
MTKEFNIKFEKAVHLLVEHLPLSDENSRKPILFHDIRVGVYLYNNDYSEDLILAGLLHDAIEWSSLTEDGLRAEFGDNVVRLIKANSKDDSIIDKEKKTEELITRCVQNGEDALVVKTADILDSFNWYSSQENKEGISYCIRNANVILRLKPDNYSDKIFNKLRSLIINNL